MATTDGMTRTQEPTRDTRPRRLDGPRAGGRLAVGLAALALGVSAVSACTGGTSAPVGNGTVTVTRTTTAPPSPSTTTSSPAGTGQPTTSSSVSSTPVAGAVAACRPSQMRVTVMGAPGGGSAGHQELQVIATNTSPTPCTLQGYPGVSLTAPGTGAQLGAAADRAPGESPLMRLEPGKTAVSSVQVAQAGAYGSTCGVTTAAGFRIYLPGQTAAVFAPFEISACQPASLHQLSVKPFSN